MAIVLFARLFRLYLPLSAFARLGRRAARAAAAAETSVQRNAARKLAGLHRYEAIGRRCSERKSLCAADDNRRRPARCRV